MPETTNDRDVYRCVRCGTWYRVQPRDGIHRSCTVLHAPGVCCHFGETLVGTVNAWDVKFTPTDAGAGRAG